MPSIASRQQVLPGFRLSLGCALVLLPGNVNVLHRRVHGAWADRGRQSLADAPRDEAMAFMRKLEAQGRVEPAILSMLAIDPEHVRKVALSQHQ